MCTKQIKKVAKKSIAHTRPNNIVSSGKIMTLYYYYYYYYYCNVITMKQDII